MVGGGPAPHYAVAMPQAATPPAKSRSAKPRAASAVRTSAARATATRHRASRAATASAATAPAPTTLSVRTPAGPITLTTSANATQLRKDLERYLKGARPDLGDYALPEGTEFQRRCWKACRSIPYGQTRTYAWLAEKAGRPGAARAAGQAMRRNPMPVVVPCHRVVGSSGWIGGFAGEARPTGASVNLKRWLLELESEGPKTPTNPSGRGA